MMIHNAAIALAVLTFSACQTVAQQTPPPSGAQRTQFARQIFADPPPPAIMNGLDVLPPPPQPGDALDRADRASRSGPLHPEPGDPPHGWSETRRNQAVEYNQLDPFMAFDSVLGPDFRADRLHATNTVLLRIAREVNSVTSPVKDHWRKPRPFVRFPSQQTCIPPDDRLRDSGSYSSGHTAMGWAWGLALTELEPDHADALMRRAYEYGESRMVCGVHWRSDIESGRMLGAAVLARLHADDHFRDDMRAAYRELHPEPAVQPAPQRRR